MTISRKLPVRFAITLVICEQTFSRLRRIVTGDRSDDNDSTVVRHVLTNNRVRKIPSDLEKQLTSRFFCLLAYLHFQSLVPCF